MMDVGRCAGMLIDIACEKAGTQAIELNNQLADMIMELLF